MYSWKKEEYERITETTMYYVLKTFIATLLQNL